MLSQKLLKMLRRMLEIKFEEWKYPPKIAKNVKTNDKKKYIKSSRSNSV